MYNVLRLLAVLGASSLAALWLAGRFLLPVGKRAGAALLLLPLVLTGRAVFTGGFYGPLNIAYDSAPLNAHREELPWSEYENGGLSDVAIQMVPWRKAVREAVKTGQLPLLNRFTLSGDILLASAQPGVFHPNTWIGFLLPLSTAWTFACAFTLFLTGLFAFLFLRDIALAAGPAFFGAAAWTLSEHQIVLNGWPNAAVFAALPLLLLGLRRLAAKSPGGFGATAVSLVLMLLPGHHESVLHAVSGAGVFFLVELFRSKNRLSAVARSVLAGALALGLSAAALLPFLEALPQTAEAPFRKAWYAKEKKSVSLAETGVSAFGLVVPGWFGGKEPLPGRPAHFPWAGRADIGGLALALAALGLASRRREKWGLLASGLLAFLVAIGMPGLTDFVSRLPLFDIAINPYLTGVTAFCLAALAALGLAETAERPSRGKAAFLLVWASVILVLGLYRKAAFSEASPDRAEFAASLALLLVPILLLGIAALLFPRPRVLSGAAVALLLLSRAAETPPLYLPFPSRLFYPHIEAIENLPKTPEPYRTVGLFYAMVPNQSALWELEDPRGYQAMSLARYVTTYPLWCVPQPVWFNRVDDATRPFLSFLNVRFAIGWPKDPTPPGWREVVRGESCAIFENPSPLPRAFAPERIRFVPGMGDTVAQMMACADFGKLAWIEAPEETSREIVNGRASVVTRRDGYDLDLTVRAESPAWIVVSQSAWKGWKALLAGRPLPLRFANQAFLGFRVPEGDHRVRLVYRPDSFRIGAAVSAVSLAAAVAVALRWNRRRRTARGA